MTCTSVSRRVSSHPATKARSALHSSPFVPPQAVHDGWRTALDTQLNGLWRGHVVPFEGSCLYNVQSRTLPLSPGAVRPGPAADWIRLRVPLVAGEETSPFWPGPRGGRFRER